MYVMSKGIFRHICNILSFMYYIGYDWVMFLDCTSTNLDTSLNQCELNREADVGADAFEMNPNYQFWSKKVC